MIDTSRNIINTFFSERSCKFFQKKKMIGLHDKEVSGIFASYLKNNNNTCKYLFTKKTIDRIEKMDISKLKPESLSFLTEKYLNEFSFCFLELENISFSYFIDLNSIKIVVFNGSKKRYEDYEFQKAIIGSAVINFNLNDLRIIVSNPLQWAYENNISDAPKEYLLDLKKASENLVFLDSLNKDFKVKNNIIFTAVKCFVFLKTASVIDKTFVSDSVNKKRDKFGFLPIKNDVVVINSFYDESIFVLNPFSVNGHFRQQPTREGVKTIYIDSFMKNGYERKAKILNQ